MKKQKSHLEEMNNNQVEVGTGSIYEQLGYTDYKEMETKSTLVMEISKAVKTKKLTQIEVAKTLGISQPKLSALLNGRFRGYSVERLIHFLNELGKDVDIVVKAKPRHRRARVNVYHSKISRPKTKISSKAK